MKKFKFKSNRKYLHGTDIYNYFIKKKFKDIKIVFKKKIIYQPKIINCTKEINLEDKLCTIEYNHQKKNFFFALVNSKKKINQSYEYNEIEMYNFFKLYNKKASCNFKSKFSSIETLVALNKFYHNKKIKLKNWYFSGLKLYSSLDENIYKKYTINLKKNILNKFTITNIYKNNKKIGEINFIAHD